MPGILVSELLINLVLVGHQVRVLVHMALNNRCYVVIAVVVDDLCTDNAVSLNHDEDRLLAGSLAPLVGDSFLLAGLATKVLFVDLNNAAYSGRCFMTHVHHLADGMTEVPGSLLRDADQLCHEHR